MNWVQYASLALGAVSCLIAAAAFIRTGRWRDTDEAQALVERVSDIERRMSVIENEVEDLPTKADVARLEEQLKGVGNDVKRTQSGVDRIESYFLKAGVEGRS